MKILILLKFVIFLFRLKIKMCLRPQILISHHLRISIFPSHQSLILQLLRKSMLVRLHNKENRFIIAKIYILFRIKILRSLQKIKPRHRKLQAEGEMTC